MSCIRRHGSFRRASDGSVHRRYRCQSCRRTFSDTIFNPCYRQRKRAINPLIVGHLCSGVSLRRSAILLSVNRKTITRKFLVLGRFCELQIENDLDRFPPSTAVEFDDLETFEHTKLKPLSILTFVESRSARVLGFNVVRCSAKGRLAVRSIQKYGRRKDERRAARAELFARLSAHIEPTAVLKSDRNPHYVPDVKKYFPRCEHQRTKGRRGCVVGQGELKAGGEDPLFFLNHTLAMFRDNVKRLSRRTWCTTKRPDRLRLHLAIYALYHNWKLIQLRRRSH